MVRMTNLGRSRPLLLLLFSSLLALAGLLGAWGVPLVSSEGMVIRSHWIAGDLPTAPDDPAWSKVAPMTLPLSGQVITRPVWPEPTARALVVRSLHNGTEIAFLLEWQDNTKNDRLTPGTFRDGVAIGLPLGDAPAFFCMGQLDHYINIWHWKADWQSDIDRRAARQSEKKEGGVRTFEVIPRRISSVEDLIGGGFSTLTTKEKQGRVQGKAFWKDGIWHVVMRRPLASEEQENEAKLIPGRVQTISFAVWNGENKERNGQKAVAPWFQLSIDPVAKI
ncbi:ethylbenzene dehydrogenase-related protein [Nitrospira moscoviensis]|uniref:Putative Nitrite oxidoreductase, membrane subunit n=1 Tax=Nitrospira moscoviensis TaxID=42253 RepID=A0A0K2GGP7_NITMO|nr:ethylbenzene dehydrogenase-related protein [Nitrospira moscoviensis]ALA60009.1 putative Nitrite oxidoreductase, membrane subunit [Nitrospira moscoviensis]